MNTANGSYKRESGTGSWTGPPSSGTSDAPISGDWPDWWVSSLRGSLASPTARPDFGPVPPTTVISGRRPLEPFATWDPGGCCWRTFQASLLTGTPEPWSESWPASAMTASGTAYRLRPLVPHTSVGGGSVYPTPLVSDAPDAGGPPNQGMNAKKWNGANSLGQMARQGLWPTPTVHGNNNREGLSEKSGNGLQTAVRLWPSPGASDGEKGPDSHYQDRGRHSPALPTAVQLWPTPQAHDARPGNPARVARAKTIGDGGYRDLNDEAARWPTPVAPDAERQSPAYPRGNQTLLGAARTGYRPLTTRLRRPGPEALEERPNLLLESVHPTALESARMNGGLLNPRWVEWLMGLPIGWTSLEPLATESYRQWYESFCGGGKGPAR